ncbi:hypothetical protein J40TS1_25920 [Paenibacillus montaniterrae]|uniref:Uncharacterized protein n=1 Tax=Paenibacillus montaniterrae TaxID=429341 RepID=A0A919YNW7_9BACL|nr:hypothetical protein [Paenibacillus montaniterrae]GIP16950.1 hypothetical protein J40TS1_25920 [Paenibacillus montaniterrae]
MELRYDLLLNPIVILCTLLLIAIPLLVHYINRYLHTYGDPPWKQPQEKEEEE